MKSKNLLILELETEEAVVATISCILKTTNWQITVLGSDQFLSKLRELIDATTFRSLVLDSTQQLKIFNWDDYDLVLLPNPKFMSPEYIEVFLNLIGDVPFGIGVFDSNDLTNGSSVINRSYGQNGSSLLTRCSFIYISDADFVNRDNALVGRIQALGKSVLVIPFKYPGVIEQSKLDDSINIIISGKVQAKRRRYLMAILSVFLVAMTSGKRICLYLNGRAVGFYGRIIFYLSKFVNRLVPGLTIICYQTRVDHDVYCDNLRKGHINLLPLTQLYADGKDTGAFYDSMQYNMVTISPNFYLRSIGSLHGAVSLGYRTFPDLVRSIRTTILHLEYQLTDSYSKALAYKSFNFRDYLINELNSLSKIR